MGEDGSLVFDTQLDQTGFVKGSQKVLDAIKDLVSAVDTLGDNMMRSFGQIVPLLQSVAQSAASINERLAGSATQAADANAQVVSSEEQVAQAVQTATNAINQQNQATQNMTAGTQAAQSAENTATQMAGSYDKAMARIQKQIDSLKAKLADYYSAVAQIQQSTDETLALTNSDEQAAKVLEMEEVQLEKLNAKYASKLDTLKALEAEYERLAALQAQQNASPNTSDWDSKGLSAQIEKAIAAVDRYEQKMDKMNYMGATDDQWRSIGYDITQAAYKLDDYRAALDAMRANGLIDDGQYTQLATALEQARQKAVGLAQATQETRRFSDILKSAASSALRLTASLAKIPLNAARTGFKKLGQSVGEYIKKAQNAKLSSNSLVKALTSVKRMLISRVKRMFISGIFNGVKESLSQLAQYSTSFGAAMNRIKTAASGLKTNLASTIGGLIEAVEPFVTRFLNMLSKMVSYVNAAFSFLRGKSTITTANTAASSAQSYSNNMGSAASNTKKAAEAQKELNRQVYGFDELNKRMDEEKEDETPEDYAVNPFTDSPISDVLPENLKDWLQELKDLWNNEDYFGFGQKLAEKLNEMMQIADDWINNVFRPQGVKWAKNIAEVLNGLVDGFDAKLLGKLLADGLNAVFDIVNTFLETFDFEKFGTKIGQTITSWFANVEWDLIGRTFANGVNAIIDTLHGLVNAIDWDNAGKSISTFFNTFLLGIDWNKLVKTVSDGVKGLETALIGFIDGIKWREIADSLAESLEHLDIAGILTKAGQIIGDLLKGIMEFVAEFVKQVDWSGLMQGIWDGLVGMLQSIDWGGLISVAFELLGAAVGAAASLAATLISNILNLLVTAFEDGWDYFADYIDKCGGDIVAGLLLGIVNALVNIGQWIWEHIFKPFWDGLCHAFGIASPSIGDKMQFTANIIHNDGTVVPGWTSTMGFNYRNPTFMVMPDGSSFSYCATFTAAAPLNETLFAGGNTIQCTESVGSAYEASYGADITRMATADIPAEIYGNDFTADDIIGLIITFDWYGWGYDEQMKVYIIKKDYSVIIPDLNDLATYGDNLADAFAMAMEACGQYLFTSLLEGENIPEPTPLENVQKDDEKALVNMVCVNLDEYARSYDDKAVKKTLSIPAWLNTACDNIGINYSEVLKDALIAELQMRS